jgi:hypothetical protein
MNYTLAHGTGGALLVMYIPVAHQQLPVAHHLHALRVTYIPVAYAGGALWVMHYQWRGSGSAGACATGSNNRCATGSYFCSSDRRKGIVRGRTRRPHHGWARPGAGPRPPVVCLAPGPLRLTFSLREASVKIGGSA